MEGVFHFVESMTPDETSWYHNESEIDESLLAEAEGYFTDEYSGTVGPTNTKSAEAQAQVKAEMQQNLQLQQQQLHQQQQKLLQHQYPQTPTTPASPFPYSQAQPSPLSMFSTPVPSSPFPSSSFSSSGNAIPGTLLSDASDLRPPPPKEEVHGLLVQIKQSVEKQDELLTLMDTFQRLFLNAPTTESFNQLVAKQLELKQSLATEAQLLGQLRIQEVLSLPSLVLMYKLMDTISVQTQQLQLYQSEMMASLEQKPNPCVAALVIESQPFPSIYKEKTAARADEDVFKIRLLKCSSVNITLSRVQVSAVFKNTQVKSDSPLDPSSFGMDPTLHATFKLPRFLVGSRMQPAVMKFDANVSWAASARGSVSVCSRPYIVVTHESQFEESMKNLFIHEVFRDRTQIPWKLFANELSIFFVKATRQNLSKLSGVRALSPSDLHFLQTRKFCVTDDGQVTVQQFETFWADWFGKVLRELRFKRRLMLMWELGLVCGFIDKDSLKLCMQGTESGHVMLRFSESQPGAIAATAWVGSKLWNGLIKSNDTKTKSHADFIRDKHEITHVLQFMNEYTTNGGFRSIPVLRSVPKATALYEFCSVKEDDEDEGNPGYDNWDTTPDVALPAAFSANSSGAFPANTTGAGGAYPFNVYNSNFSMFTPNTTPTTVPANMQQQFQHQFQQLQQQQQQMQQQQASLNFDLNSYTNFNLSNYTSFTKQ